MSNFPITVIMPVCDGEAFIGSAIKSVLNQSYKHFELWVLENGSHDRTVEIVESFTDPRIKLFELGPVGVVGALQYALEHAETEWLARMDADDLMFPQRLETQMHFIRENSDVSFVGTAYGLLTPFNHIFEPVLKSVTLEITKKTLTGHRPFVDPSIIFNRRAAIDAGGADREFPKVDGVPLMFRLLTRGKAWALAEHLHLYRLRPNSLSRSNGHGDQSRRIRLKYAPEFLDVPPRESHVQSFWNHIARLELLASQMKAVRHAAKRMKREGPFEFEANCMVLRSTLGSLSSYYYRWRNRDRYKHRPDWERLFQPMLGPSKTS